MLPQIAKAIGSKVLGSMLDSDPKEQIANTRAFGTAGAALRSREADNDNARIVPVTPIMPNTGGSLSGKDANSLLRSIARVLGDVRSTLRAQLNFDRAEALKDREDQLERKNIQPTSNPTNGLPGNQKGGKGIDMAMIAAVIAAVVAALQQKFKNPVEQTEADIKNKVDTWLEENLGFNSQDPLINHIRDGRMPSTTNERSAGTSPTASTSSTPNKPVVKASGNQGPKIKPQNYATSKAPPKVADDQLQERYAKIAKEDPEFHKEMVRTAKKHNIKLNDLYIVMDFESAGTFDPSKRNPKSSAIGLIQFMTGTYKGRDHWAKAKGYTREGLGKMNRAEQMKVVDQYFDDNLSNKTKGRRASLSDLYLSVAAPAHVGSNPNKVIYKRGSREARDNQAWDVNKDGQIQAGEVAKATDGHARRAGKAVAAPGLARPAKNLKPKKPESKEWKQYQARQHQKHKQQKSLFNGGRPVVASPNAKIGSEAYRMYFNTGPKY